MVTTSTEQARAIEAPSRAKMLKILYHQQLSAEQILDELKARDTKIFCFLILQILYYEKSNYVCPRTLAVNCDKASDSIPRKIVKLLQDPKTKGIFRIKVT